MTSDGGSQLDSGGLPPSGKAALEIAGGLAAGVALARLLGGGRVEAVLWGAAGAAAGAAFSLVSIGAEETVRGREPIRGRETPSDREVAAPSDREATGPSDREAAGPSEHEVTGPSERGAAGEEAAMRAGPEAAGSGSRRRTRRDAYEGWTKARLYERAKELDIHGRSRMTKAELIEALLEHGTPSSA